MLLLNAPTTPSETVEVVDNFTYDVIERWWETDGKVYRQIVGQEPELTPFKEVPFVKIPSVPW